MSKDSNYNWSNACLLLAIIYASNSGDASLEKIIAAGDYINHAILHSDELEGGFARLTSGGYVEEKNGIFSVTDKVMRAYSKTTSPHRAIHEELKNIEELL